MTEKAQELDKIEEVDLLRLKLVNRDVDLLETQIQLAQLSLGTKRAELQVISQALAEKYNLENANINPNTGDIVRNAKPTEDSKEPETV